MSGTETRVLVVDDEEIVRESLGGWLEKDGYPVASAPDGLSALERLKGERWNVILLDLKMPGGTGEMALERLKTSTLTSNIPVIVVSGTEDPKAPETVKGLGAVDFVKKPVDVEALADSVQKLVGK